MTHAEIREAILANGWQGKSPGETVTVVVVGDGETMTVGVVA